MKGTEQNRECPRCRAMLPIDAPEGLCPRCLMALNLAAQTEEFGPEGTKIVTPKIEPLPIAEIAKLFPQFEIIEFLGRGGMGLVYKARQPRLDRFVALKILAPDPQNRGRFAERFEREARALAKLSHPNIVSIYDFGQTRSRRGNEADHAQSEENPPPHVGGHGGEDFYFLAMEFVDGVNLRELIRTQKVSPEQALAIVPPICDALQFAHTQGIVHRDIKPENILLDKQGRVKIADFGIAKILGTEAKENLTGEQQTVGTPHYMAPEQIEKPTTVDHRADIYSLGVVFYEMLTGELPLGKFQAPSKKVQVDVRLDEVVLHALEKEPERRYQHVSEVKTDVQTIASSASNPADTKTGTAPVLRSEDQIKRNVGTPGLQFRFNPYPALLPGERVLHFKKWLWAISSKSPPGYRLFFSFPPFWDAALYLTDRRVIVVSSIFRLLYQDFSIWFSQKIKAPNVDVLKSVSARRGFFGSYLETNSEASEPPWYRSSGLRVRIYTREAESLQKTVSAAQKAAEHSNFHPTQALPQTAPGEVSDTSLPMPGSQIFAAVAIALLLILTAWGNALAMMIVSATALMVGLILFRKRGLRGGLLVALAGLGVAAAIGLAMALNRSSPGKTLDSPTAEEQVSPAVPPVVVRTVPESGVADVDPALTELRVTFSEPMQNGSWSWVKLDEETFPEMTGKPRYLADGRTCVLPVKLQPGKVYSFWLNVDEFKNFQDTTGQSAIPYLLIFETRK